MNDNKELNTLLDKLFNSVKDTYDISRLLREFKDKEVSDKPIDFEILQYTDITGFRCMADEWTENMFIKCNSQAEILLVKRLSDNQEFGKGDKTDEGTIKEFYISENILWVRTEEKGGVVSLNDIQKAKERVLLFTTEDRHNIFEYDTYPIYKVDKDSFDILQFAACDAANWSDYKYFFDLEKAKEYVLMNKPCLSLEDLLSVWDDNIGIKKDKSVYTASPMFQNFMRKTQSKLNNQ